MEKPTKHYDDTVLATSMNMMLQDWYYKHPPDWMKMTTNPPVEETPDQRLKKLFADEKISADKYSEMFGRCTHRDVDDLAGGNRLPTGAVKSKSTVVDMIEQQIRDTHQFVRYNKDHVLVLGWNKMTELDGSFRGLQYERRPHGSGSSYYYGIEIVPPATQDDGNTVRVMRREDYVRLANMNGCK